MPNILSNRRFQATAIVVAIVVLVLVVINIFLIGGDEFVIAFNSSLTPFLAIIITILAAIVWRRMSAEKHSRLLWAGMLVGWALWALAEIIWEIYLLKGWEMPYPSVADFFWLLGYVPMGIGLVTRVLTMPTKPTRSQSMIIWGASAATILIAAVLIFRPIFQSFDPERLIESVINITYPLADLFLLVIGWRLFFTYEGGDYGFVWRLLTVGFIFMTVSDFIYTYSTWQEIYYPDSKVNLISWLLVDIPYTIAYLIWFLGVRALLILLRVHSPVEAVVQPKMVQRYGHILIYTKNNDTVIDASPNFNRLFDADNIAGKPLAEILPVSEEVGRSICEKIRAEGKVADLPIQVLSRSGVSNESWLCGVAIFNLQKEYTGADLLLRVPIEDGSFDEALSQEAKGMVRRVLNQSGSNYKAEIRQFLADYHLPTIKSLLNVASSQGGAAMSQSLVDELQETARKHNWQMQVNAHTVLDSTDYPLEVLREALPVLVETAKGFVSNVTGPAFVAAHMKEQSLRFSEAVHREAARYGKLESDVVFADNR